MARLSVAVLASGRGLTFEALSAHSAQGEVGWKVRLLVTDRPEAEVIHRARNAQVLSRVLADPAGGLLPVLEEAKIDLVVLAGYLRLIAPEVVSAYRGRMLNIHPSLLPAFGGPGMYGIRVHRAVLESGVRVTGTTVHQVNEVYDDGAIVAQWPVRVALDDTPESLARRVQGVERRLYPRVLDHAAHALVAGTPVPVFDPFDRGSEGWMLPPIPISGSDAPTVFNSN